MTSETEVHRRVFHLVAGLIMVSLIYYGLIDLVISIYLLMGLLALGIIVKKVRVPVASWFFEKFDRPKDFVKLPGKGSVLYLIGLIVMFLFFPKDIVLAGMVILTLGDGLAPIIGKCGCIPNPFNRRKFLEGSIGGGMFAFVGALLFVSPVEAASACIIAMASEGVLLKRGVNLLDDNIVMPLVAGLTIFILRYFIG